MMTGLAYARGALVFLIDCDLEEAPELLEPFHARLRESGADVVYGVQTARKGRWFERLAGHLFFRLFNLLSPYPLPVNVLTVRLMTRRYVESLLAHRERALLIAGLWVTPATSRADAGRERTRRRSSAPRCAEGRYLRRLGDVVQRSPARDHFHIGSAIVPTAAAGAAADLQEDGRHQRRGLAVAHRLGWLLGGLTIF
jgi:glycosyltransferase involved in cell wall biosynthesis